ncbi:probable G-protein coupled receptor 33 [Aquarana catesbeiana]|uniref:probable G-protein coupled receptor 33 n=1 Tax=Aquarana catesbeiana TaxID=8400 RepID=UPI003CC9C575
MINTFSPSFQFNTSTESPTLAITASKLIVSIFLFIQFLFGLVVNALYLWVLKFRMKPSVNNVWLFHLVITNLVFLLLQPISIIYVLMKPHWIFGMFLCKVHHSMISFCLFAAVFLITGVSLNRYLLVYHPHWYIRLGHASAVCYGLWGLAILCSSPYLLFRVTKWKDNFTICYNDYTFSGKWENVEAQVKWGMFFFRVLVSFLLPSVIIAVCHFKILFKIKSQRRSSTKPYKVIFLATATFLVCLTPYHIAYGMSLARGGFENGMLLILKMISTYIYSFIGPICYLFIMEDFTKEFRKFIHLFAPLTS